MRRRTERVDLMQLSKEARDLIGSGTEATLVTLNPDGAPQVTLVWTALTSGSDGDELVTAHLAEHKKVRNVRRDGRVAMTIMSPDRGPMTPYLSISGTARVEDGGAPEVLAELAKTIIGPDPGFPPADSPPGYLLRVRIHTVGGVGPWAS
jgi:PPOX class probable F420-dependent enzyme